MGLPPGHEPLIPNQENHREEQEKKEQQAEYCICILDYGKVAHTRFRARIHIYTIPVQHSIRDCLAGRGIILCDLLKGAARADKRLCHIISKWDGYNKNRAHSHLHEQAPDESPYYRTKSYTHNRDLPSHISTDNEFIIMHSGTPTSPQTDYALSMPSLKFWLFYK
jgi:hypothetical protein